MVTLTGFADEISSDLDTQLDTLHSEGIRHIEFRGVWNKGVLQLSDEDLERVKEKLENRGFRLSCIGSPIGKIAITDDFHQHLDDFDRIIDIAHRFGVRYIRIFSFFIPDGDDPAVHRNEVMRRMGELVNRAEKADVILLHENEKEIYGDTGERCRDIFETCPSPNLRCAFDSANFVQCGVTPFDEAFLLLEPYVEYVHIKDALFKDGRVVPAGEGDGQVKEVLQAMQKKNYHGYLSLEPHLSVAGTFSGFSGPDLFVTASRALKKLLSEIEEEWD